MSLRCYVCGYVLRDGLPRLDELDGDQLAIVGAPNQAKRKGRRQTMGGAGSTRRT
jgi:hypothetical protein